LATNVRNGPVNRFLHQCVLFPNVDVTQTFVPDITHDLPKGIMPNLVQKIIHRSVRDHSVTHEMVNTNLQQACKDVCNRQTHLHIVVHNCQLQFKFFNLATSQNFVLLLLSKLMEGTSVGTSDSLAIDRE